MKKIKNTMCKVLVMCILITMCTTFGSIDSEAKTVQATSYSSTAKKKTLTAWAKAYMGVIKNSAYTKRIKCQGAKVGLFYIDNDSIPELVISGKDEDDGCVIISYKYKKMRAIELYRQGVYYIPKSGLILNVTGSCCAYTKAVYKLNKGDFSCVGYGNEYYNYERGTSNFWWNGKSCSLSAYNKKIMAAYKNSKGNRDLAYSCKYNYNGILNKLATYKK